MLFINLKNIDNLDNPYLCWRLCSDKSAFIADADSSLLESMSGTLEDFIVFYNKLSNGTSPKIKKSRKISLNLLVPGNLVTYTTVSLPTKSTRQIKQAIPYIIEDFLVGDPEHTQISIGKINPTRDIRVALLDKTIFKKILSTFSERGLVIDFVSTIQDIINSDSHDLTIVFNDKYIYLNSRNACLQIDDSNQDVIEEIIFSSNNILIYYPEGDKLAFQKSNRIKISLQGTENSSIKLLPYSGNILDIVADVTKINSINLLDDLNKSTFEWYKQRSTWIPMGYAFLSVVLLQLSLNFGSAYFFNKRSSAILKNTEHHYKDLFPDDPLVDVHSQWTEKLNGIHSMDPRRNFSYLFYSAAKALSKKNDPSDKFIIQQFRYDEEDSELKMVIEVKSISVLESLKDELRPYGILVEILSANEEKNVIKASLLLRLL